MKVRVTTKGVTIPRSYFEGIQEVEVKKENGLILLVPITDFDPISEFGKNPIECASPDASENHDKYLYKRS